MTRRTTASMPDDLKREVDRVESRRVESRGIDSNDQRERLRGRSRRVVKRVRRDAKSPTTSKDSFFRASSNGGRTRMNERAESHDRDLETIHAPIREAND